MSSGNLPFNWFDLLLLIVVMLGVREGRKRGMSEQLMSLLKWLTIVVICAFTYQPLGKLIADTSVFSPLSGYVMAYLGVALIISAVFGLLKKITGEKLVGSDVFGRSEFYLGMLAGMIRFCCMLIFALALLNARAYSSAEVRADIRFQNNVYGKNYFPSLYSVQAQVFKDSLTGPWIKEELSPLLIKATEPTKAQIKQRQFAMP